MIALLALSLVSPVLTFSGGSDTVFLEFLVKTYHQPVVILADAKRDWRKASVPATGISKSDQIDLLLKRIDGEPTRDGTLGVSRKAWPTAFHILGWRGIYQIYAKRKVKTSEVDSSGKLSIETEGTGGAKLEDILPTKIKKPITWHWFFSDSMLLVNVEAMDELSFAKLLAKSLGATVVDRGKDYYLDLDPMKYKDRAIADFVLAIPELKATQRKPFLAGEAAFSLGITSRLETDLIRKLMSKPQTLQWKSPPPDVVELVHQRLMNIYANTENGSLFSDPEKLFNEAAKKWDFTHPTIDLNSGGLHSTEFYGPAGHLVN